MASIPSHSVRAGRGLLRWLVATLRRDPDDQADSPTSDVTPPAPADVSEDTTPTKDTSSTQLIVLSGDLRDPEALLEFHRRCQRLMQPGRRCIVCDLKRVACADTRLVASLVAVLRRARSAGVVLQLRVSPHVRNLIVLCRVEQLLHPEPPTGPIKGQPR